MIESLKLGETYEFDGAKVRIVNLSPKAYLLSVVYRCWHNTLVLPKAMVHKVGIRQTITWLAGIERKKGNYALAARYKKVAFDLHVTAEKEMAAKAAR